MDSPSSQAVFLFVVRKGRSFFRRLTSVVATSLRTLCAAVLRAIVTVAVFTACVMVMLHFAGVPLPGPAELLDKFEAVGRLTRILS
jgi:hypothetical protein